LPNFLIGDAFDLLQVDELSYDAIVTDPPYRIGLNGKRSQLRKAFYIEGLANDVGSSMDFDIGRFLPFMLERCKPFNMICFCGEKQLLELMNWAEAQGFNWRILTWHKKNPIPFKNNHLLHDTEFIIHCREKGAYFPNEAPWKMLKTYFIMDSPRREIGRGQRCGKSLEHPCTKPLKIMENLVQLAAPRGAHLLDPFAGSGATIRAAIKHGRDCTGYDINPKWEPMLRAACDGRQSMIEEGYATN
jgi:site-specific DNA-methyltransferase (adenine-specific)